jgi:lysophospholipase L1-like esterase
MKKNELVSVAGRIASRLLRLITKKRATFNSVDSTAIIDFFNSRPVPSNAYRVLFIGDSLTIHGRSPKLWDYFSGMAASSPDKDFVHLSMQHLQAMLGPRPVEGFYNNGGDGKLESMYLYLKMHPELDPDLVVLQGGENDSFDENFRTVYRLLLNEFSRVIALGDWWSDEKSEFSKQECSRFGFPFVDLRSIEKVTQNSGNPGPYGVSGVALHPNDAGMSAIASAVVLGLREYMQSDFTSNTLNPNGHQPQTEPSEFAVGVQTSMNN